MSGERDERPASVDTFEQALRLDRAALHALLETGRPEQRIWAVWTLAMWIDDGAQLGRRVSREPDIGVRRTLAVLLAGHGEHELLVALAETDPAISVRASAMQLVTRLAAGGLVEAAVVERGMTREPELRIAILGAIGGGAPAFLVDIARRMLRDRSLEIRLEAFEALLRVGTPETFLEAREWMVGMSDLALVCDRWLHAASAESLADAFAAADLPTRTIVLSRFRDPPWIAVERLVGDDVRLLRSLLDRKDIDVPARVLATAIIGGAHEGFVQRLADKLDHAGQGRALLRDLRKAIEGGRDNRASDGAAANETVEAGAIEATEADEVTDAKHLRDLAQRARQFAEALEVTDATRVLDDVANHHPVEHLLGLENALVRWLVAVDVPSDLAPLLPELFRHCTRHFEGLKLRRRKGQLVELQALHDGQGNGPYEPPWPEHESFKRLVDILKRLVRPR